MSTTFSSDKDSSCSDDLPCGQVNRIITRIGCISSPSGRLAVNEDSGASHDDRTGV